MKATYNKRVLMEGDSSSYGITELTGMLPVDPGPANVYFLTRAKMTQ